MAKIKSVKLKHDYRDEFRLIPKGTWLTQKDQFYWKLLDSRTIRTEDIVKNKSDIFEIEYEPETKSITVKIEYQNSGVDNSDLTDDHIWKALKNLFFKNSYIEVTELK